MKIKGIARKLDRMGRLTIPKEIREAFGMREQEKLEMILVEDGILVKVNNNDYINKLEEYTKEELINELERRV